MLESRRLINNSAEGEARSWDPLRHRFILTFVLAAVALPAAGGEDVEAVKEICPAKVAAAIGTLDTAPVALRGEWSVTGSVGKTAVKPGQYRAYREFDDGVLVEAVLSPDSDTPVYLSLTEATGDPSSPYQTVWTDSQGCRVLRGNLSMAADGSSATLDMSDAQGKVSLAYSRVGEQRPETPGGNCTGCGMTYRSSGACCSGYSKWPVVGPGKPPPKGGYICGPKPAGGCP